MKAEDMGQKCPECHSKDKSISRKRIDGCGEDSLFHTSYTPRQHWSYPLQPMRPRIRILQKPETPGGGKKDFGLTLGLFRRYKVLFRI